jgi:hypothetical protein
MKKGDPVVETYSKLADVYDDPANLDSCWAASPSIRSA